MAEPHRREILRLLQDQERSAGEIAAHFSVTRSAISQHLRVLKETGLIVERREATRRLYRIRPDSFVEIHAFVASFWEGGLERLKSAVESDFERDSEEVQEGGPGGSSNR